MGDEPGEAGLAATKSAAHRLGISESTSRQRVSALMRRVGAGNAAQAVWALRRELEAETRLTIERRELHVRGCSHWQRRSHQPSLQRRDGDEDDDTDPDGGADERPECRLGDTERLGLLAAEEARPALGPCASPSRPRPRSTSSPTPGSRRSRACRRSSVRDTSIGAGPGASMLTSSRNSLTTGPLSAPERMSVAGLTRNGVPSSTGPDPT